MRIDEVRAHQQMQRRRTASSDRAAHADRTREVRPVHLAGGNRATALAHALQAVSHRTRALAGQRYAVGVAA